MGSSESRRKIAARIELFSKTAVLGQRGQCLVRQVPTKGIKIACDDRRARS